MTPVTFNLEYMDDEGLKAIRDAFIVHDYESKSGVNAILYCDDDKLRWFSMFETETGVYELCDDSADEYKIESIVYHTNDWIFLSSDLTPYPMQKFCHQPLIYTLCINKIDEPIKRRLQDENTLPQFSFEAKR